MIIIKLTTLQYYRDISMIHYYNTLTRDEKLKLYCFVHIDSTERVLRVTKRNQQMICQVLFKTFASQDGDRRTPSDVSS